MLGKRIIVEAPGKVNLLLSVGERRDDGYHRVRSIYHTIGLADTLSFELVTRGSQAPAFSVECDAFDGIPLEDNLIYRAHEAFTRRFGAVAPDDSALRVRVRKRIPMRAGLGGGSTDAAAMLFADACLSGMPPSSPRLLEVASTLGADVAFFLHGGCAYMEGRGDVLKRAFEPLSSPLVIIDRGEGVSTAEAYRVFDADPQPRVPVEPLVEALISDRSHDMSDAADSPVAFMANNLEPAACALSGSVSEQLAWLRGHALVRTALVSGSGSSCFALCASPSDADVVADEAACAGFNVWRTQLVPGGIRLVTEETTAGSVG